MVVLGKVGAGAEAGAEAGADAPVRFRDCNDVCDDDDGNLRRADEGDNGDNG